MSLDLPGTDLPEAVAAGLAGFPPRWAARALAALRILAAPPEGEGTAPSWTGSELTGDGFPLELAFTTADPGLRWIFDPGPPGACAALRTEAALSAMARLGQPVAADLAAAARSAQVAAGRFGAWVGGRHDAAGDGFKLYVELLDGAAGDGPLRSLGIPWPRPGATPIETRMLGFGPAPGRVEVYFRTQATRLDLPRLLEPAGRAGDAGTLAEAIEAAWGHRVRDRLPGGSVGISYVRGPDGLPPVVTLFFFARSLWGGDARIRQHMLARLAAAGAPSHAYASASAPVAARRSAETRHGLVGLTLAPHGISWSVGLRPVCAP